TVRSYAPSLQISPTACATTTYPKRSTVWTRATRRTCPGTCARTTRVNLVGRGSRESSRLRHGVRTPRGARDPHPLRDVRRDHLRGRGDGRRVRRARLRHDAVQ